MRMNRRALLRAALGASAALPLVSNNVRAFGRAVHGEMGRGLATLDPHQNATVTAMADLIIPVTETPGATAAKVNEFIDVVLTGWYDDADRQAFLTGLADVDARSHASFQKDFVDGTPAQQTGLLAVLDDETSRWHASPRDSRGAEPFFHRMKWLTVYGYYTSQIGAEQDQRFIMIPGRYVPCAPVDSTGTGDL